MKRDPSALESCEHDVLVIGGGIAGAWAVWEAASRGLRTALVELDDFGQATSWSSLKTAHGGLRHLKRLDLAGFRESMRERRALLHVAPEIVRPLSFAIPAKGAFDQVTFQLAGLANDVLSFDRNKFVRQDRTIAPSRILGPAEAAALCGPAMAGESAFVWQDAQVTHTERLLLSLLHAASDASAVIVNHCRIESGALSASGFEVKATDLFGGAPLTLRARAVVNASGQQLETVARLFGETCASPPLIRGVNVVLGRSFTPTVAVGAEDRGRFLFLVPWNGRSILGTAYDLGTGPVQVLVRELLEGACRAFPWTEIRETDIQVVHAGHVPGAPNGEPIYRSRLISHSDPRIVSILTAKYTTARATAEAAIDRLGRALSFSLRASVSASTCLTMAKPLEGTLSERIRLAEETEMALSHKDALRGRQPEGGSGEMVGYGV